MRKVYKFRLLSTKKQVQRLNWTLDMCRILYNSCLLDRRRYYDQTGKGLTRIRQQEILKSDKQRIAHLKEIHSRVLQDVLFRVDRAFQAFFRRGSRRERGLAIPVSRGKEDMTLLLIPSSLDFS
jgi:putative transposase